jgi:histidinol dehydrogenase
VLVAVGEMDVASIEHELKRQCDELPRRDIAAKALAHSYTIIASNMEEVC